MVHTHPREVYVKGATPEFANAPSEDDALGAGAGNIPNYVLGPDYISRVSGRDAGYVNSNNMSVDMNGNVIKFVSDYFKVAELYEINTGQFRISEDALIRQKRRTINGKKK